MGAIASLTCFMLGRNAWSLLVTHLGVLGGTLCAAILAVLLTGGNSSEPAPVSYTHLDVYKRQALTL